MTVLYCRLLIDSEGPLCQKGQQGCASDVQAGRESPADEAIEDTRQLPALHETPVHSDRGFVVPEPGPCLIE